MFRCVAPLGRNNATRHIVDRDGVVVLEVSNGEWLQRLGNDREYEVRLPGKHGQTIYCDYGGVIRIILRYLNCKPSKTEWELHVLEMMGEHLDNIKARAAPPRGPKE